MSRLIRMTAALLALGATAVPATAAAPARTKLVSCGAASCLAVSGHRATAMTAVLINGHPVAVEGQRKWQVRLPLDTLRGWSEPQARTITVATYDEATRTRSEDTANLPIGLLGHVALDSIVIAMK